MRKPIHEFDKFTDLKDMLKVSGEKYGDRTAYMLKTDKKGEFKTITHKEFRDQINELGTKLIEMGLKGKRIAVIGENRYEWGVAYLAIVTGTGVVVPLDKALPENEIESLIIRSEVEAIFYSKKYDDVMAKIQEKGNTNLRYYISMDIKENEENVYSMEKLIKEGKELLEKGNREFLDAKINPEEMQIMLFTSGTTSMSKAVKLSHKNIVSNLMDITSVIKLHEKDVMLSFLPLHHTFESTVGFLYPISKGCKITFCDGIRHIAENIKEYKITAMISVPALYEGIYKQVVKAIKKQGKWEKVQKGIKISNTLRKIGIDIRAKLFKEIKQDIRMLLYLLQKEGIGLGKEAKTNAMRMLDKKKIAYEALTYEVETFIDGMHCAELTGAPVDASYKTLVMQGKSKQYYVFVIPIACEVDLKKAARSVGEKSVEMIHVKDITKITGYVRGGCSPLGMKKMFPTVIDESAKNFAEIYVSGGRIGLTLKMKPQDLVAVTNAQLVDIQAE